MMTEPVTGVETALSQAECLLRDHVGEPVTLALCDAVGYAISDAHVAAHASPVEGFLRDLMDDTDAVEDALLALWHNDGGEARVLTEDVATDMVARLDGEDADLPEPSLTAYEAAEAEREGDAADAAERYFRVKMAEAIYEVDPWTVHPLGTEMAVLAFLPDDLQETLEARIAARLEDESPLPPRLSGSSR